MLRDASSRAFCPVENYLVIIKAHGSSFKYPCVRICVSVELAKKPLKNKKRGIKQVLSKLSKEKN